jgi:hypothetical protein
MVLATRSASLFSSRSLSLLTSFSRPSPSHWRTALHSSGHPGVLNRTTAFRTETIGSSFSRRLLTTQREKVKVLAILYDGGKHAEEVRARPLLAVILFYFSPASLPTTRVPVLFPIRCRAATRPAAWQCYVWMRGTVERVASGFQNYRAMARRVRGSGDDDDRPAAGRLSPSWRCLRLRSGGMLKLERERRKKGDHG